MSPFSFVSSMIFQTRTKLIQDPYVSKFAVVMHLYLIFFKKTFIEKLLLKLIKKLVTMSPSHNILFCSCYVRTVIISMNTNLIHITTT